MGYGASVDVEVRQLIEVLIAHLAHEVFQIQMNGVNVILEVSFLSERPKAACVVASERLLPCVSPQMAVKLALVQHYLAAFPLILGGRPVQAFEKVALLSG